MNRIHALLPAALCCLAAALPAHAASQLDVSYLKPDEFSDAGRGQFARERTMSALTQYLQQLARKLPEGQTLRIEVTDIDLAGEIRQTRAIADLRVLRGGADWPQMDLRYTLLEGSRTVKSGEVRLADPAYLSSGRGTILDAGGLSYEKRMLKRWFDETITGLR